MLWFFLTLDKGDISCLVYFNFWRKNILSLFEYIINVKIIMYNLNGLSIQYQYYAKATKRVEALGQEIFFCHAPNNQLCTVDAPFIYQALGFTIWLFFPPGERFPQTQPPVWNSGRQHDGDCRGPGLCWHNLPLHQLWGQGHCHRQVSALVDFFTQAH